MNALTKRVKKMKNRLLILFALITIGYHQSAHGQADSVMLGFDEFMQLVKAYHPVARQGEMLVESGEINLMKARGGFDPVIKSQFDQKQFDGKQYYQLNTNQIEIPTALGGLKLKAGYDRNTGSFVNPENQLPENGLAYAGVAIPIGEGLLFDERRQVMRQAEVFEQATLLERRILINQLVFDASKAYWDWYAAYSAYEIFDQAVALAEFRYEGIKESFEQGDVPAIDTLEAFILVQNRQLSRSEAVIRLQQARLEASNFLWSENMEPLQLAETSKPLEFAQIQIADPLNKTSLSSLLLDIENYHPKIKLYANKLENLDFERRMKIEKVKPKLNVNYNFLNQPVGNNPVENYSSNDYKWGFEFPMPLLLRKARGDLQLTKLKMKQTDLSRQNETLQIKNKVKTYQVEIENLYQQIELYRSAVSNYLAMLSGEKRKFEEGESSLFVVNSRDNSLITAEVKLIELVGKYQKAQAGLELALGGENDDI
jgi:outer membrane protein TolC